MGLNDTPFGERIHIGFFGKRNAGKSSLVNALTGQELSVVSPVKGTTTDPVKKAMELLPLGPVVLIDTPGLDDEGELGALRMKKTGTVLETANIAVLVVDAVQGMEEADRKLLAVLEEKKIPRLIAWNKSDLLPERPVLSAGREEEIYVSSLSKEGIPELKEKIGSLAKRAGTAAGDRRHLVSDLLLPGELTVLVIPVDEAAPRGRLILPQQQVIREILDSHGVLSVCQDSELKEVFASHSSRPRMVITDSQVFGRVEKEVPPDILLTSFSILFARYKGELVELVKGAVKLDHLKSGDQILISEGCTHHRQCNDIGSVKLPAWIENYTGIRPEYTFSSGADFPENLADFSLIIHCGGCMLTEKEMKHRIEMARRAGVPVVNYGVAIAQMHGMLRRSLEPFPEVLKLLERAEQG